MNRLPWWSALPRWMARRDARVAQRQRTHTQIQLLTIVNHLEQGLQRALWHQPRLSPAARARMVPADWSLLALAPGLVAQVRERTQQQAHRLAEQANQAQTVAEYQGWRQAEGQWEEELHAQEAVVAQWAKDVGFFNLKATQGGEPWVAEVQAGR